jgi:hypothetical protein
LDSLLLSPSLKASLTEATERYAANVHLAASYLEGRGIGESAALSSRLGVVCDAIPGHERFAGWLSIPYVTDAGTVAMKFRCIEAHDCKAVGCQRYDAPAGQKTRLYNARVCAEGGDIGAVVEGEFKAIVCTDVLGIPAVSTNAGTWLDHWPRAMANFDRVLVIADNDFHEDGSNPGRKHAEKVQKTISGAELALPPLGVQLDDWVLRDGAEGVRKAIGL